LDLIRQVQSVWSPLSQQQQADVVKVLQNDLLMLGDVMNGSLPISLLQTLEQRNIHLLPENCGQLGGSW